MPSFSLATEPWIPCIRRGKAPELLSLEGVFASAHELDAIQDVSPLATLALHRLLLAILHRVIGPFDLDEWCRMYKRGRFDARSIGNYLGEQRERLDLLHPKQPFMQVRGLTELYEPDGLGRLVLERSRYGPARELFAHRPRDVERAESLSFAEAARALLVLHAFAPGGLVKKAGEPTSATAGPLNRGAFVLVSGRNVFETLLLNLVEYDPDGDRPFPGHTKRDLPAWEQPPLQRPLGGREPGRAPHGWIDLLTWRSRRLELTLTPDGTSVGGVVYCVGQGLDADGLVDPMLAARVDDARGLVAVGFSEERAVWRDCHAFIRETSSDGARAPLAVRQLARSEVRAAIGSRTHATLLLLGMRGDKGRIKFVRMEQLAIPLTVLADPEQRDCLHQATRAAEEMCRALRTALRRAVARALAAGGREADKEEVGRLVGSLGGERRYWVAVGGRFDELLDALARRDPGALVAFVRDARAAALTAFGVAARGLGTSARQLEGAAQAEYALRRDLHQLVTCIGGDA
jgi:CRISPR system Cascade subunit CasA